MSEATASVSIDTAAPVAAPQRAMSFFGKIGASVVVFLSLLLSRTLWVTILGAHMLYKIYWTADQAIYTFKEPWQAQAHVQLFGIMFASISSIVLGYLGFTKGSQGIAGFVQQTFSRSTTVTTPAGSGETVNRNSRADRDE
tara:strand:+ start:60 stop:482 length:423 start_codon:yes stop_codon:yes gene_type:complete